MTEPVLPAVDYAEVPTTEQYEEFLKWTHERFQFDDEFGPYSHRDLVLLLRTFPFWKLNAMAAEEVGFHAPLQVMWERTGPNTSLPGDVKVIHDDLAIARLDTEYYDWKETDETRPEELEFHWYRRITKDEALRIAADASLPS